MQNDNTARNKRVTNVVLDGKIDHLSEGFHDFRDEIRGWRKDSDGRQRNIEVEQARQSTQIENQDKRLDNLDKKVKIDIAGTAIGGAILALAAALGIKQ